jgi:hypothetical protein
LAGSAGFRFTHAFFRQTLYEEIFAPRRVRRHRLVATSLEDVYACRLDEHAAELAEQFSQSTDPGDLAKAVQYGELAASRARRLCVRTPRRRDTYFRDGFRDGGAATVR